MPSLSRIEQQEHEAFVSAIERRSLPPLEQFRVWMMSYQPKDLDKPSRHELLLLTVSVLLLPLVVAVLVVLFLTDKEHFTDMSIGKRILLLPASLVLLPCAVLVVLYSNVMRPMFKRMQRRREALSEAGRALHELTRTIPRIRTKDTEG